MTTPTREQVVAFAVASTMWKPNGLPSDWNDGDYVGDIDDLVSFATLARADLEATITEQSKEIEQLKISAEEDRKVYVLADNQLRKELVGHVAEIDRLKDSLLAEKLKESEQKIATTCKLASGQYREAQLREACKSYQYSISNDLISVPNGKITETLAIPTDDTALREYGAKLVERVASGNDLSMRLYLKTIVRKIREGTF